MTDHTGLFKDIRACLDSWANEYSNVGVGDEFKELRERLDAFMSEELLEYDPIYLNQEQRLKYAKLLHQALSEKQEDGG
jgi:hypothetical protein